MRLTFSFEVRQWVTNAAMQGEGKLGALSVPQKTTTKEEAILHLKRQRESAEAEVSERAKRARKELETRWANVSTLLDKMLEPKGGQ